MPDPYSLFRAAGSPGSESCPVVFQEIQAVFGLDEKELEPYRRHRDTDARSRRERSFGMLIRCRMHATSPRSVEVYLRLRSVTLADPDTCPATSSNQLRFRQI